MNKKIPTLILIKNNSVKEVFRINGDFLLALAILFSYLLILVWSVYGN